MNGACVLPVPPDPEMTVGIVEAALDTLEIGSPGWTTDVGMAEV